MALAEHCPRCGATVLATGPSSGRCSGCEREVYANSRPTAGVLLVRDGQVLLIQRGAPPCVGSWDIPGGFLEEGEAPEDGARREIREELGLELGELRLALTSINRVEDGAVLDILFEGEAPAAAARASSDAMGFGWFPFDALPEQLAFESTRSALQRWIARRSRCRWVLADGTVLADPASEPLVDRALTSDHGLRWTLAGGTWDPRTRTLGRRESEPGCLRRPSAPHGPFAIRARVRPGSRAGLQLRCGWGTTTVVELLDDGSGRVRATMARSDGGPRLHTTLAAAPTLEIYAGTTGEHEFLFVGGQLVLQRDGDDVGALPSGEPVELSCYDADVIVVELSALEPRPR